MKPVEYQNILAVDHFGKKVIIIYRVRGKK